MTRIQARGGNEKQHPISRAVRVFSRRILSFATSGIKEEQTVLDGYEVFLNKLKDAAQTRRRGSSLLVNTAVAISDYVLVFFTITASVAFILLLRVVLLDLRVALLNRGRVRYIF